MPAKLTLKQRQILEFIEERIKMSGLPPTLREICEHQGLRSRSGVLQHLKALEKKGYITRGRAPRSITMQPIATDLMALPVFWQPSEVAQGASKESLWLPVYFFVGPHELMAAEFFLLHVTDDTMGDVGLHPGDFVLVKKGFRAEAGDIVVVKYQDKTLIRRWGGRSSQNAGLVTLEPENIDRDPILTRRSEVEVLGKVVGLIRVSSNLEDPKKWMERERGRTTR